MFYENNREHKRYNYCKIQRSENYVGGGIVWQKPFMWKVYKVNTVNTYKYRMVGTPNDRYPFFPEEKGDSVKFNEDTGKYSLYDNESHHRDDSWWVYATYDGELYSGIYGAGIHTSRVQPDYKYNIERYLANSEKKKGDYINNVFSTKLDTYPKNGIKGDYWYELIE